MMTKKKLSLIDSSRRNNRQSFYYDVVSLIDDVRIKIPHNLQENLLKHYIQKSKFKSKDQSFFKNDFDILSVQRNLKILEYLLDCIKETIKIII